MIGRTTNNWIALGLNSWLLACESAVVVGLRTAKFAVGGPAAIAEAKRMVTEKIVEAHTLQIKALRGNLGRSPLAVANASVARVRRKVRANTRRLSR